MQEKKGTDIWIRLNLFFLSFLVVLAMLAFIYYTYDPENQGYIFSYAIFSNPVKITFLNSDSNLIINGEVLINGESIGFTNGGVMEINSKRLTDGNIALITESNGKKYIFYRNVNEVIKENNEYEFLISDEDFNSNNEYQELLSEKT